MKIGQSGDGLGEDNNLKSHTFPNSVSKGTLAIVHGFTCIDVINTDLPEADTDPGKRSGDGGTNSGDSSLKKAKKADTSDYFELYRGGVITSQ